MKTDYLKYYRPKPFIGLIIISVILMIYAKDQLGVILFIFGLMTSLIILITKHWWHLPLFRRLFWIDNFSGRYEGKIVYQYRDNNGEVQTGKLEHIKIICQTGSHIHISSFTKKTDGSISSPSVNKGMYVESTADGQHFNITYPYLNDGSLGQSFSPHYGTDVIKFIRSGKNKKLTGTYYTSRQPYQTKGEYKDLKWVSDNKKHDF